jgi:ornithine carbamoyltransferase
MGKMSTKTKHDFVGNRDFLDICDLDKTCLREILNVAKQLKEEQEKGRGKKLLEGKQLAMIFEKNSTRTRVSFEVGINQLGGNAVIVSSKDSQIGRGEPILDTAKVLSRYVDIIMIRTFSHDGLKELAEHASVPVINGLTDYSHPCQIMADIMAVEEHIGDISSKIVAWVGDVNNVCRSWIHAAEKFGFELRVSTPKIYADGALNNPNVKYFENPLDAVFGAHVITTDTWVSMGDEVETAKKKKLLKPYQVNSELVKHADKDFVFLHCLPAHRGEEVTVDIIDGNHSVIYDEAENRLHAQKAILLWCFGLI